VKAPLRRTVWLAVVLMVVAGASRAWAAGWYIQSSPNPGLVRNVLNGVAMNGTTNAWAVGFYTNSSGGSRRTLVEHYDGIAWSQQSSPNANGGHNQLLAVKATSGTNVWAVGWYNVYAPGLERRTLIEHYDGSAWSRQGSPSYVGEDNTLEGVAATSSTNAWAVGYTDTPNSAAQTLVEHYDGTSWAIQSSPNGFCDNLLHGVGASSDTNAWAVGQCGVIIPTALAMHYDGSSWTIQSTAVNGAALYAVTVRSSTDAWAVGADDSYKGLIEHYDGTSWTSVPTPQVGSPEYLYGVRASSSSNAYAVGEYYDSGLGKYQTLVLHWDGVSWTQQSSPSRGSGDNVLNAVAATDNGAFAVGIQYTRANHSMSKTLVLACC
jgi:hypothetical protein